MEVESTSVEIGRIQYSVLASPLLLFPCVLQDVNVRKYTYIYICVYIVKYMYVFIEHLLSI